MLLFRYFVLSKVILTTLLKFPISIELLFKNKKLADIQKTNYVYSVCFNKSKKIRKKKVKNPFKNPNSSLFQNFYNLFLIITRSRESFKAHTI